jgi:glycosyltransferase involved in cell wall biosynthesis
MTILGIFLINQIRTGGDRDYIDLLELLASRGNNVLVLVNSYLDYKPQKIIPIFLPVKYVKHHLPPASFLFKRHIKKNLAIIKKTVLKTGGVSFIHIHGDIYLKSAIYLKKILKAPLFYASRNNDIERDKTFRKFGLFSYREYLFSLLYENINKFRERQISKYSDIITFMNNFEKQCFINHTGHTKNNISIIPNSIRLSHFDISYKNKNYSTSVKKILYVGHLSSKKGFFEFLKLVAKLKNAGYLDLEFFALGRKENIEPTLSLMKKLNIMDAVSLEGFQNPLPYFEKCDIFIYPTPYEAFGNVITEALFVGCPVLASFTGGIPEILEYPELMFQFGNLQELFDKIVALINDPEYYLKVKELCRKRIDCFNFDWEEQFEKAMADYIKECDAK